MCVHGYRENRQNGLRLTAQKMRKLVQTHEKLRNEKKSVDFKKQSGYDKENVHEHAMLGI